MKRILSVVLLGLLVAPTVFSGAQAAEVRIGEFRFVCQALDGKRLKPKFGDIAGVIFIDLPAQRESCRDAVDRKIAWCRENTVFASNTLNREHAGCLPVFEKQARDCVAFFQRERVKCDAGSTDAAELEGEEKATRFSELWSQASEAMMERPESKRLVEPRRQAESKRREDERRRAEARRLAEAERQAEAERNKERERQRQAEPVRSSSSTSSGGGDCAAAIRRAKELETQFYEAARKWERNMTNENKEAVDEITREIEALVAANPGC